MLLELETKLAKELLRDVEETELMAEDAEACKDDLLYWESLCPSVWSEVLDYLLESEADFLILCGFSSVCKKLLQLLKFGTKTEQKKNNLGK